MTTNQRIQVTTLMPKMILKTPTIKITMAVAQTRMAVSQVPIIKTLKIFSISETKLYTNNQKNMIYHSSLSDNLLCYWIAKANFAVERMFLVVRN